MSEYILLPCRYVAYLNTHPRHELACNQVDNFEMIKVWTSLEVGKSNIFDKVY